MLPVKPLKMENHEWISYTLTAINHVATVVDSPQVTDKTHTDLVCGMQTAADSRSAAATSIDFSLSTM